MNMRSEIKFLEKCTFEQIEQITNCLQEQFPVSSRWEIQKIKTRDIIPLCKNVYTERLKFARKSIDNCKKYNIPLFYPYMITYADGSQHIIVPPIIENRGGKFYLGDGIHRIYSLIKFDIEFVYAIIVHDCCLPLPGIPQKWSKIRTQQLQLPGHLNFENFCREGLTGYSRFCNSDVFWKYKEDEKWTMEKF